MAPSEGDGSDPVAGLVLVADELQDADAVMESLFAVWPVCPQHDWGVHPRVIDDRAVWRCEAGTGHVVADIGRWADNEVSLTRCRPA